MVSPVTGLSQGGSHSQWLGWWSRDPEQPASGGVCGAVGIALHGSPAPSGLVVGLHFLPLQVSGGPRELAVMLDAVRGGPASGQKLGSDAWLPSSCRQGGLLGLLWELHERSPSEGMTFLRTSPGPPPSSFRQLCWGHSTSLPLMGAGAPFPRPCGVSPTCVRATAG